MPLQKISKRRSGPRRKDFPFGETQMHMREQKYYMRLGGWSDSAPITLRALWCRSRAKPLPRLRRKYSTRPTLLIGTPKKEHGLTDGSCLAEGRERGS